MLLLDCINCLLKLLFLKQLVSDLRVIEKHILPDGYNVLFHLIGNGNFKGQLRLIERILNSVQPLEN